MSVKWSVSSVPLGLFVGNVFQEKTLLQHTEKEWLETSRESLGKVSSWLHGPESGCGQWSKHGWKGDVLLG